MGYIDCSCLLVLGYQPEPEPEQGTERMHDMQDTHTPSWR